MKEIGNYAGFSEAAVSQAVYGEEKLKKRIHIIIVGVLSGISLFGCLAHVKNASEVHEKCKIKENQYENVTIEGPYQVFIGAPSYLIRCTVKNNHVTGHQIYVRERRQEWAFIDEAIDIRGERFNAIEIKHLLSDDEYAIEIIGIDVPREYLNDATILGINMKLKGKDGSVGLKIPAFYVEGYLQCVDNYMGTLPR